MDSRLQHVVFQPRNGSILQLHLDGELLRRTEYSVDDAVEVINQLLAALPDGALEEVSSAVLARMARARSAESQA